MAKVLIVDDDKATCRFLAELIGNIGHEAESAHSLADGMEQGYSSRFDVVFLDVRLPDGSGLKLLPRLKELPMSPEVIIMTGQGEPDGVELAIHNGAWDYLQKPLSPKKILLPLKRVLQYRDNLAASTAQGHDEMRRAGIVGKSYAIKLSLQRMWDAARSDAAVLLAGETGTGNLIESTLFGHVRGAFTGADKSSGGVVREADGGTLFLDEIGELPMESQRKFLRVLQEKRFRPVGGKDEVTSDFRLVVATNQDLEAMAEAGTFRRDLLYRLQTMAIFLPPLRDRLEDIPALVDHFNKRIAASYRVKPKTIAPEVLDILTQHEWTGNVRELANSLEGAMVAAMQEPEIFPRHLPERLRTEVIQSKLAPRTKDVPFVAQDALLPPEQAQAVTGEEPPSYKEFKHEVFGRLECEYLERVLEFTAWNIAKACKVTGLGRSRLYTLLKKHDITR